MKCFICDREMTHSATLYNVRTSTGKEVAIESLYKCLPCDLLSSSLPADPDIYNKEYMAKYVNYSKTHLGRRINQARWDFIRKHLKGGRILDWGCGAGQFIHLNPNGTFFVEGYDINPWLIYSHFKPEPGHFDVITCWDSLEHMENPKDLFARYSSEWFFAITPDRTQVRNLYTWKHHYPHEHIHYFNERSLTRFLSSAGYAVVEISRKESTLRDPDHPEWLISVAAKREG